MDVLHVWSQRYAVKSFDLLVEKSAFQSCMDRNNCRFLSVHFFVYGYHLVTERGFLAVLPCRISTLDGVLAAKELCQILDLVRKCISCCLYGTSDTGACKEFILIKFDNTDIGRSLYQSLDASAHLLDAERELPSDRREPSLCWSDKEPLLSLHHPL